jgi:surfactin synthase thioesterase subunit
LERVILTDEPNREAMKNPETEAAPRNRNRVFGAFFPCMLMSALLSLGHSWGGILAMEYALKYQRHLKGLIISNMMGFHSHLREVRPGSIGARP